ncbi:hypothetical protein [Prescottella agglutinans]|uniref:Gliding motility protein n=1 Tax=Prescottella agglutinans TaxID=1644129 RepID=A0ABT6M7M4_9NOCA|nr:hypothetical protein [Prescottella agglutinans]MDH6279771.1 hypothetical protein [Prescottella agglutinans]
MTDSDSPAVIPCPGDVFVFPLDRIGRYGVCQVVAVDDARGLATVAVLAWTGTAVPEVATLADTPRMVRDFMFWTPAEIVKNVPIDVPTEYVRIGALPVTGETASRSYDAWDFASDVIRQYRWDSLPSETTAAFRMAIASEETVTMPGLTYSRSGALYESRLLAARAFSDDTDYYSVGENFRMESLRAWPALYQLALRSWRDDLLPFLETSPLVKELTLTGHGQREIDLSRTSLDRLAIDVTGLERLVLPPGLDILNLHGTKADADADLHVVADDAGRWITVHLTGTVPAVRGLDRVRGLRIGAIENLNVADVAEYFPSIAWLHLFGAPGLLDNLDGLQALPRLAALWICDLFGYGPDDFPGPEELPSLTSLDLDSVPADVAARVRARYKKAPHVELSVRRPRKPEWLAENLENPLRHWDGRDGIPGTVAKKARTSFIAALRQVRDESPTDDNTVTAAATGFLDTIAALNRKHQFLYTLEREEVVDAVNTLTAGLSPEGHRALEPLIEEALDD